MEIMQWTGGYAPRLLSVFRGFKLFPFDSESRPTHQAANAYRWAAGDLAKFEQTIEAKGDA